MLFTSKYEHTLDAKNRLAIPAEIRSRLDPKVHGNAFYLAPGANGHLWLWPEKTFEHRAEEFKGSLVESRELMDFEESFFTDCEHLPLDSAGRVHIPPEMLAEAGLGQTIMICGVKDHLELRDPAEWKASRAEKRARRPEILLRALHVLKGTKPAGETGNGEKERP